MFARRRAVARVRGRAAREPAAREVRVVAELVLTAPILGMHGLALVALVLARAGRWAPSSPARRARYQA